MLRTPDDVQEPEQAEQEAVDSNRYVHPHRGTVACLVERLANSGILAGLRRQLLGRLPFPVLSSDVVHVVYATWLVDAERARPLVPPRAVLWERKGLTPFTILSYRHGHFGPRAAGRLRRLFPSPLQSNWRLYLESPLAGAPDCPTVAFVKNVLDSTLYALGTRMFSDVLPSHLASRFSLSVEVEGIGLTIEPGAGSAPALQARFDRNPPAELPEQFAPFATSWPEAVHRLASQDAAVITVPGLKRTALATISLPVEMSSIEPLRLRPETLDCPLLARLDARVPSLSFLLPNVHFQALSERLL